MGASSLEDENNISLTSSEGSEDEEGEDDDEVEDFVNRPESHAGDGLVGGVDVADFAAPLPPLLPPFVNEVPPVQNEVVAAIEGGAVQNEVSAAVDGGAVQVSVAVDGGAFCADGGDPNEHSRRRGSTSSRKSSKSGKLLSQKTKNSSNKNKERTNVAGRGRETRGREEKKTENKKTPTYVVRTYLRTLSVCEYYELGH